MRIVCVGGGPASLYFSIVMKKYDQDHSITVLERNPVGSTYGWGVTYWGDLLDKLREGDALTARAISEHSVRWEGGVAHIRDEVTTHRGDEGFSIGRQRLLDLLAERATDLGVRIEFGREIESSSQLPDAELIVAGDGVNSRLRQLHSDHFGTEVTAGQNKFIWLGTSRAFERFTFAFVETESGWIWFYAYRFTSDLSTCIVECSAETWAGLGFDRLGESATLTLLETIFAKQLDGQPLINRADGGGSAPWLNFRTMTNATWHHDNIVLLGDAAHTTHYSIGAGTTLALEDAIGLAGALHRHPGLQPALAAYEQERKRALLSTQSAARYSAQWYENIPRYIHLKPAQLFSLLGQRHSPLLPHVPPQMYYWVNQAAEEFTALRKFRKWLGPKVVRTLQARRPSPL
ncbi:2-polyprenyl-6-methoxyphenol hydroxylase-like FAD-dependent oxidoreductase [Streptacidiphilus sp. MAP12-16]|uniref:FAD-dependent monooxygenase n=1 Tax=Streptacidiphilus sp. MAP12-16 TaxID=3156300 RepID=UPI003511FA3C